MTLSSLLSGLQEAVRFLGFMAAFLVPMGLPSLKPFSMSRDGMGQPLKSIYPVHIGHQIHQTLRKSMRTKKRSQMEEARKDQPCPYQHRDACLALSVLSLTLTDQDVGTWSPS